MSDLDLLRSLGDQLVPPSLDDLRETGRRRDRRARIASAVVASAAVVAVTATSVVLGPDDPAAQRPSGPVQVDGTPARPLTYADGSTIHYGAETVVAEGPVVELDVTDDGVGFRTEDGRIWFTDGTSIDEIGALGDVVEPGKDLDQWVVLGQRFVGDTSTGWLVSGNAGSRLMWFDFGAVRPEAVVYDTGTREVLLRSTVDIPPGSWAGPHSVTDDAGYLFYDPDPFADDEVPQVRLDLTTGDQAVISPEDYLADVGSHPARSLQISHAERGFKLYEIVEGPGHQFDIDRGRLRPMGMQPLEVRDAATGEELALEAPDGYPDTNPVWLTQWLDDDSVVLLDPRGGQNRLLVCPVPTGTCEVAVTGPASIVVPDVWSE